MSVKALECESLKLCRGSYGEFFTDILFEKILKQVE